METSKVVRASVYVDGFNLFYGLRDSKWSKYYWLNLEMLVNLWISSRKDENCEMVLIKYFTAPVKGDEEKHRRQSCYLNALSTCEKVKIINGSYLQEPFRCSQCHNRRPVWKEKQTDTNIATEMVADAFLDEWDIAYLVSADTDLLPPIQKIKSIFHNKKIIIVFPPGRSSSDMTNVFKTYFHINEEMLKKSQFPDEIHFEYGIAKRPAEWS